MSPDGKAEHPDNIPKASGFVLSVNAIRHGDVSVKNPASEKQSRLRCLGNLLFSALCFFLTSLKNFFPRKMTFPGFYWENVKKIESLLPTALPVSLLKYPK
jgi:hypothetical protein